MGGDGRHSTSILFPGLQRRILGVVIFPRLITGGVTGGHRELVTDTRTETGSHPVTSSDLSLCLEGLHLLESKVNLM